MAHFLEHSLGDAPECGRRARIRGSRWGGRTLSAEFVSQFVSRFFLDRDSELIMMAKPMDFHGFRLVEKTAAGFWYRHSQVRILPPQPSFCL
jgi:hypothetical protein